MLYLIMKCRELDDGWECDADRKPIAITDNWHAWVAIHKPKYPYEVYANFSGKMHKIKNYEEE